MPIRKSLFWVDVGMALFVAAFVVIFVFVQRDVFVPIMIGYVVALTIWAFIAESALMHAETHEGASVERPTPNAGVTEPLPH
ncbi:MAG: hypothetical protein ACC654_11565 [Acidimicrobiia bacterium]